MMFQMSSKIRTQVEYQQHLKGINGTKKKNPQTNIEKIAKVQRLSVM